MKRIHIKSTPTYIEKLSKSLGVTAAAKALGITDNAVKKYIKEGKAPYATEVAAQSLHKGGGNTAIIQGEAELLAAVRKIMELGNGRYTGL